VSSSVAGVNLYVGASVIKALDVTSFSVVFFPRDPAALSIFDAEPEHYAKWLKIRP